MNRDVIRGLIGLCFVFAANAGCGKVGTSNVPVSGVVTINGTPTGNLLLQFAPDPAAKGNSLPSGSAVSDESGRYAIVSDDGGDGLPPGKYKVSIIDNNLSTEGEYDPRIKPKRSRVTQNYLSSTTTPIEFVVDANKKDYPIKVTGSAR